jgi:hypothetical protein
MGEPLMTEEPITLERLQAELDKLRADFKACLQFVTRMDNELQQCRRLLNKHAEAIQPLNLYGGKQP